jgi:uncharacterized protein (TIGR02145 family)
MSILNCINTDSCSTQITKSDLVTYIGLDLLCTNIQTSEDLTEALTKIEERICSITGSLTVCCPTTTTTSSSTTTTTTTECPCPTTTTTTSSSSTTTTTSSTSSTSTTTSTSTSTTTTSSTSSTTTTSTSTTSTTTTIYVPTVNICDIEVAIKNLNVSTYRNGDVIPQVTDPAAWAALTTGAWCYYNNDSSNQLVYGKLYNWYAVNDPRGLAPLGYHVMTHAERLAIQACLGGSGVAGGKMKEIGTSHWAAPNTSATNSSGFTALPGGIRRAGAPLVTSAPFQEFTLSGYFWTATPETITSAYSFIVVYNASFVGDPGNTHKYGMSVRIVKD